MAKPIKGALGKGWRFVSELSTDEALIAKVIKDLPGGKGQGFLWLCVDPTGGERAELPTASSMPAGVSAPAFCVGKRDLIFESSDGISSFNLRTKRETMLIPIDSKKFRIWRAWVSADRTARIVYFLLGLGREVLEAGHCFPKSGLPGVIRYKSHSLHAWDAESGLSRLVAEFKTPPAAMDVDWARETVHALMGQNRPRELVEIRLQTGDVQFVRSTDAVDGLSLSPRGTALSWRHHDSTGILEILPAGRDVALTESGWYPSYSPDGQRFAFTVGDYEIWFNGGSGPERVFSFPPEVTNHSLDRITWCRCGNHFAVCLAGGASQGTGMRPLVLVDCARREVLLIEGLKSVGTTGERVWVPRRLVQSFFPKTRSAHVR